MKNSTKLRSAHANATRGHRTTTKAQPQTTNPFLIQLCKTFHVDNTGLAIFLLVLCILFAIFLAAALITGIQMCLRRKVLPKRKKRPMKPIYLDDLVGGKPGETSLGFLEYSLEYVVEKPTLKVGVVQATHLPPHPGMSSVNPYVGIRLYRETPGSKSTAIGRFSKTSIRHNSSNPTWQQDFPYPMTDAQLRDTRIQFTVYDSDNLNQDRVIGQADVLIRDLDMAEYVGQIYEKKVALKATPAQASGVGEMCVGLAYYPQTNRVDVSIYEARHLSIPSKSRWGKQTLKVKVKVKHKRSSVGREETKEKTELSNPYFSEKMSFTIKNSQLDHVEIQCQLIGKHMPHRGGHFGQCLIGPTSMQASGLKQWDDACKEPNRVHVVWHTLSYEEDDDYSK